MARGQDAAGCGGARVELSEAALAVLVQHRFEAEAVLALATEQGIEVELVMLAGIGGPAFIEAIEALLGRQITADCDDQVGLALESLRLGLRRIVVRPAVGGETGAMVLSRLQDMARQLNAEVRGEHAGQIHVLAEDGRRFVPIQPHELP
jgi:hypothetical protein